jgi:hypothetical protein
VLKETTEMNARGRVVAGAIVLSMGLLPVFLLVLPHANGVDGDDGIVGAIGVTLFSLSPHVALFLWASWRHISRRERILATFIALTIAIPGHMAIYRTFKPPFVVDGQAPLVLIAVPLYQWLAIACVALAIRLQRFLFSLLRRTSGVEDNNTSSFHDRGE